jgi:tetratricopeptide (TPR) repeat protein
LHICAQTFPHSQAALSLLGHCYYQVGCFEQAVHMYEQLVQLHPARDDYKLYYAQALYKVGGGGGGGGGGTPQGMGAAPMPWTAQPPQASASGAGACMYRTW